MLFISEHLKFKNPKTLSRWAFLISILLAYVAIILGLALAGIPEYVSLFLPVPVATALYLYKYKPKKNLSKTKIGLLLTILVTVGFLLPPAAAFLGYNNILSQTANKTDSEKASSISHFVATTNVNSNLPYLLPNMNFFLRHNSNLQKYLMTGVGACGEMANSTVVLLNQLGLDARVVSFPGEDHVFVEVKLNGTWFTLDPGYFGGQLLTREQRANYRIAETTIGAISYVIAFQNGSFIELTQDYVPTDTIVIKVNEGNLPKSNVPVYLTHTFMGKTQRLPSAEHTFNTDSNGTVTLHLGELNYSEASGNTDHFFKIYVDGKETGLTVQSSGSNETRYAEIDFPRK